MWSVREKDTKQHIAPYYITMGKAVHAACPLCFFISHPRLYDAEGECLSALEHAGSGGEASFGLLPAGRVWLDRESAGKPPICLDSPMFGFPHVFVGYLVVCKPGESPLARYNAPLLEFVPVWGVGLKGKHRQTESLDFPWCRNNFRFRSNLVCEGNCWNSSFARWFDLQPFNLQGLRFVFCSH